MNDRAHHDHGAHDLRSFSLLEALFGRRSRRFGAGMEIPDGPLAYRSKLPPQPLSEAERTILIAAAAGISGLNFGIPYTESGSADKLSNYCVRPVGRTYPSGAATYGSELLITDDSGSYITRFRDLDAEGIQTYRGPNDLAGLIAWLRPHIIRLSDTRVELPREYPHISAHNRWVANQPGSTLFVPVGDQIDAFFNRLWIALGEATTVSDPVTGRLFGEPGALIAAGQLMPERALPLPVLEASSRSSLISELSIAAYNVHLLLQAFGLGGWLYSGINPVSLLGGFANHGVPGFGFRFRDGAFGPEPVGLDGQFEPLVPPYVHDLREAAERFAARKFGPNGNYSPTRPGPFRDNAHVKANADRYSDAFVTYLGSVAQDIHETYGRFPSTVSPVTIAAFTQAHHIDLEFYDRFYADGAYLRTHAAHDATWHGDASPSIGHR
ncbi:MAG: hypothetical protein KIT73_03820 [Burkholderiales bacterium]|nr:hypothetical protein [Burkholderiales bacterium]